jgi:type I restriction enzyme R subunit
LIGQSFYSGRVGEAETGSGGDQPDRGIAGPEPEACYSEAIHHVRESYGDDRTLWGKLFAQEALSPDPLLSPYEKDYRWLTQVYESVKPPSGNGELLWHALGAKTVDLINENVHGGVRER